MAIPLKPLGIIKDMLDGIGLQITYAYDDLIFVEHNAFLLQMGESGEDVRLYFNTDSSREKRDDITNLLKECGRQYKFLVDRKGTYAILQNDRKQELQLQFFEGHL
jgi:hypothetical protein